ncbi:MAG: hypothetical protein ABH827_02355, partial [bacterium]
MKKLIILLTYLSLAISIFASPIAYSMKNKFSPQEHKFKHPKTKFKRKNIKLALKKELQSHQSILNQKTLRHMAAEKERENKQRKAQTNGQEYVEHFNIKNSKILMAVFFLSLLVTQVRAAVEPAANHLNTLQAGNCEADIKAAKLFSYPVCGPKPINLAEVSLEELLKDPARILGFDPEIKTPTLVHLKFPETRQNLLTMCSDSEETCKQTTAWALTNEIKYYKNHIALYHGMTKKLLLFQNIFRGLYEIKNNKNMGDFIPLRVPDEDLGKFKDVTSFLKEKTKNNDILLDHLLLDDISFDHSWDIKKHILSTNVALFGNSNNRGESTFNYFINSISNIDSAEKTKVIREVFDYFNVPVCFDVYKKKLETLFNHLISSNKSTGILLQIFIPKDLIDSLTYQSRAYGNYVAGSSSSKLLSDFINIEQDFQTLDNVQFRLLLTKDEMLNPHSGLKTLRHYEKTKTNQKHKQILKNILNNCETIQSIEEDQTNAFNNALITAEKTIDVELLQYLIKKYPTNLKDPEAQKLILTFINQHMASTDGQINDNIKDLITKLHDLKDPEAPKRMLAFINQHMANTDQQINYNVYSFITKLLDLKDPEAPKLMLAFINQHMASNNWQIISNVKDVITKLLENTHFINNATEKQIADLDESSSKLELKDEFIKIFPQ